MPPKIQKTNQHPHRFIIVMIKFLEIFSPCPLWKATYFELGHV